jgi:uncharacterized membrane protein
VPTGRAVRGPLGIPLLALAVAGLVIAGYLLGVRLAGEAPVCGPSGGCETVAASSYSTVLGIPVAAYGVAFSVILVGCALAWWRRANRLPLLLAYGLLLLGVLVVAYLSYLELFVIHAICLWCATYAGVTVASLVVSGLALRRGVGKE